MINENSVGFELLLKKIQNMGSSSTDRQKKATMISSIHKKIYLEATFFSRKTLFLFVIASPDLSGRGDPSLWSTVFKVRVQQPTWYGWLSLNRYLLFFYAPEPLLRHRESRPVGTWRSIPVEHRVQGPCAAADLVRVAFLEHELFCQYFTLSVTHVM